MLCQPDGLIDEKLRKTNLYFCSFLTNLNLRYDVLIKSRNFNNENYMGQLWEERKSTKRLLRKALRQANANKRNDIYTEVMEASSTDTKLFHKLIRRQMSSNTQINGHQLMVDDQLLTAMPDVLDAWTTHFSRLASTSQQRSRDEAYDKLIQEDLLVMNVIYSK